MTQSQRAAVAVETAKFNERGRPKTKESFKDSRESLNAIATAHDVAKESIVRAKTVWDAAEESDDHRLVAQYLGERIARADEVDDRPGRARGDPVQPRQ